MKTRILLTFVLIASSFAWAQEKTVLDSSRLQVVDLTHTFSEDSPRWGGFPPMERKDLYTYEKNGFWTESFTHVGQYGTHLDSPIHFHAGLRTIEDIPVQELVLPAVVIDTSEKVKRNPDYELSLDDIRAWEKQFGNIPTKSFVINRTDWSKRWPSTKFSFNRDETGTAHTPGWSLEALRFLFEERGITAIGHETPDTDAGFRKSLDRESYVLSLNRYQVELLTNVDQLPPRGSLVVVGVPKIQRGSGFPTRVLALVPRSDVSNETT